MPDRARFFSSQTCRSLSNRSVSLRYRYAPLIHLIFILLIITTLCGCGRREILFFTDPYLDFQMRIDDDFEEKKTRFERENNIGLSVIIIEQSAAAIDEMQRYIAERDPYGIAASFFLGKRLDQLLSEDPAETLSFPPAAVFGVTADPGPAPFISVFFDAREAFRRAGIEAGKYLLSSATAGLPEPKAGLFFLHPDPETRAAEEQAFSEGLKSKGLSFSNLCSYQSAEVSEDRLKSTVAAMRSEGAVLFVVNAYQWNPFLMRLLTEDEAAIVRNYYGESVYPSRIIAAVNDDMLAAFEGLYHAFQEEKTAPLAVESVLRRIDAE